MTTATEAPTIDDAIAAATAGDTPPDPVTPAPDAAPSGGGKTRRGGRRKSTPSTPSSSGGRSRSSSKSIERELRQMIESLGGMVSMFDPFDGVVITENANQLAKALDAVAADNPAIKRALTALTGSGGWGGVLIACSSIALPILAHHEVIAPSPIVELMTPAKAREVRGAPGIRDMVREAREQAARAATEQPGSDDQVVRVADGAPAGV